MLGQSCVKTSESELHSAIAPKFKLQMLYSQNIKGALDKFNIIPQLFPKKVEIFIPLKVLEWVMTACRVLRSTLTYF